MRRVMQSLLLLALLAMAIATSSSDQSFVVIGESAIEDSLASHPEMEMPTILLEVSAGQKAQAGGIVEHLLNPRIARQNELIAQNHELLASMELLSQQLGAPVLSQLEAEKSSGLVAQLQAALSPKPTRSNVQYLSDADHQLPTALLHSAPLKINQKISPMLAGEDELRMLEMGVDMELESQPAPAAAPAKKGPKHDYAFLDDPKSGGEPTSLQNLQGLDIYVVNTPLQAADHEIRPVAPPRPLSAGARQKARMGARMRAQLVRDVPQPKPRVAPKTRINTLSAYESSLLPSAPLAKLGRLAERPLDHPMVGGQGAMQMRGATAADAEAVLGAVPTPGAQQARFAQLGMDDDFYGEPRSFVQREQQQQKQQLPGTSNAPDLPHFPADPNAAPLVARVYDTGSSFDNRDGPPVLLDDLLPLKATLVEDLEPYIEPPPKPTGW